MVVVLRSHDLGSQLRDLRELRDVSIRKLAEEAGVSRSSLSRIERNEATPDIQTLMAIADVLDVRFIVAPDGVSIFHWTSP